MGIVGSCLGSCVGSAFCSMQVKSKTAKYPYIIFVALNVVLSIVMSYLGADKITSIGGFDITFCPSQDNADHCLGNSSVFRISFAMSIFFALHAIFSRCWLGCHYVCWPLKVLIYAGGLTGTFFMEQDVFEGYAELARFVSVLFILAQVILLIDFAYAWNENWVSHETKFYYTLIVIVAVASYIGAIVWWSLLFVYYTSDAACHTNKTFIALTIIFCVAFTAISISEWCKHGAILPSAVVTLYCTYVLYSALSSDPSECNSLRPQRNSPAQWIGLVIAVFAIAYAGYNVSNNSKRLFGGGNSSENEDALTGDIPVGTTSRDKGDDDLEEGGKPTKEKDLPDDLEGEISLSPDQEAAARKEAMIFHFVMLAASMYMAMILSNWGVDTDALNEGGSGISDNDAARLLQLSDTSVWVKIASQWATILLYVWTLVAPYIFTNREF